MSLNLSWIVKDFASLSQEALYEMLQLRAAVFVVEQNCPYQDLDGKDQKALHVFGYHNQTLVGYTRILPQGVGYQNYIAIGRVVVNTQYRNQQIGNQLMEKSIAVCKEYHPNQPIKISAQAHLKNFYNRLGFEYRGEDYQEDGIPHCAMYLEF